MHCGDAGAQSPVRRVKILHGFARGRFVVTVGEVSQAMIASIFFAPALGRELPKFCGAKVSTHWLWCNSSVQFNPSADWVIGGT